MTNNIRTQFSKVVLAAGAAACATIAASGQSLTPAERDQALKLLSDSCDGVVAAVSGLSEAQWKFQPAPDRWSIAQVVEHLALIEDLVSNKVLANIGRSPAPSPGRDLSRVDAMIVDKAEDRSTKFKAPDEAVPTGRWTPAEALQHFLAGRVETVTLLKSTPDLRGHAINHLIFGPLDGYEWVLAVAAHSARHTQQILEVKADPKFPAN